LWKRAVDHEGAATLKVVGGQTFDRDNDRRRARHCRLEGRMARVAAPDVGQSSGMIQAAGHILTLK